MTLAASGLATKPLTDPTRYRKPVKRRWGLQGDARLIPEVHAELDTDYTNISLYGGITLAVVPGGYVDLDEVYKSTSLYPIRAHIGGAIRLKLASIYASFGQEEQDLENGIEEWWSEEEKQTHRDLGKMPPVVDWIFLSLEGVGEFSDLFHKARFGLSLECFAFSVGLLLEFESFQNEAFEEVRLGGGVAWSGFYVRGTRSLRSDDYRLEAGFEITL